MADETDDDHRAAIQDALDRAHAVGGLNEDAPISSLRCLPWNNEPGPSLGEQMDELTEKAGKLYKRATQKPSQ